MMEKSSDKRRFMVEWPISRPRHGEFLSRRCFKYEHHARNCAAKRGGTVYSGFVGGWIRLSDTAQG